MENVSAVSPTVKTPVFITFTPEKAKELGLNNSIDRLSNRFERNPETDCFQPLNPDKNLAMAMKMPSPAQVTAGIALLPVILENGKRSIIAIFDIRDIIRDRMGNKDSYGDQHQLKAMVLPDEIVEAMTPNGINIDA